MTDLADLINQQIARFGLEDTETNCYGLVAYDLDGDELDEYPEGTVRLSGDGGPWATFIDAEKSLVSLQGVEPEGDFESDQTSFYKAVVEVKPL